MAKDEKLANGLKRLEQRLTETAKYPGFPAYLRENFEAFAKIIARGGSDKWSKAASWAMEEKLTGGKTVTAVAIQRAFEREKTKRANASTKSNPARVQSRGQERLNASEPIPPQSEQRTFDSKEAARARLRAQMKPVTIRKKE